MTSNLIPFPSPLRIVVPLADAPSPEQVEPAPVDHGCRTYRLATLLAHLSLAELEQVEATAPRSGQAAGDEVVRRCPALAEEIAAGCKERPATY